MSISWKAWKQILCLFILVGVFLLAVVPAYSADGGFPRNAATRSQVLRGRYLVLVSACADCHSPNQTPNDPYWMAGYIPGTPGQPFQIGSLKVFGSNLTPDRDTGLGNWTPKQIFNSLREGKDDEGHLLCPPMPWPFYRYMTDQDTWAIAAYLKSIKPVKNEVPEPTMDAVPGAKHDGKDINCSIFYKNLKPIPPYPGTNEVKLPATRISR